MIRHLPIETCVASRVADIRISAIKEMAMLSAKIEDSVSLAWGLPSFPTPRVIRQAVRHALEQDTDIGKYTLPDGLPELRRMVAIEYENKTGCAADADHEIVITAGNMQGIGTLFRTILNPGDEVIVTDPGFVSHIQQIHLCGARPVFWSLDEASGWELNPDTLPDLVSKNTKAIVIVTPSNPTGKIFDQRELLRIGEIARQHGLLILLDDPYSNFSYENQHRYFNLSSEPSFKDNVVYLFTFSKVYAMSGWRLGYMILPAILKAEVLKVHDANIICAPRISQIAGIAALGNAPDHIREFCCILARRRDLICERLDRIPHVFSYTRPEGAYYVFPRILAPHRDAFSFATGLLDKAKVSLTPGSAFGPGGEHHVRMAYCVEDDTINLAFDRIETLFGAE